MEQASGLHTAAVLGWASAPEVSQRLKPHGFAVLAPLKLCSTQNRNPLYITKAIGLKCGGQRRIVQMVSGRVVRWQVQSPRTHRGIQVIPPVPEAVRNT